jgi:hypothetical protein
MRPTDNDPKGNDPIDRNPTNEEIVAYMHVHGMHFCPVLRQTVGKKVTKFEFRTEFKGTLHCFEGTFLDGSASSKVLGTTPKEQFQKYARAKALEALLDDVCFPTVEAFAISCRNALGDNIDEVSLAGAIFVEGKCVDELLDALEDKRFAEVFVEPVASPAEVKTDDKELTTEDKTDTKNLAIEVKILKHKIQFITQLVTMLCVQADYHRE